MKFKATFTTALFAFISAITLAIPAEARRCDGFNGCRCGVTQARHFGLPLNFNGHNLKQASEWARAFPHTGLHVGVVMYRHGLGPTGHVSRVVAVNGGCSITVIDEVGQHADSACGRGNIFVDPNGNVANNARSSVRTYAARSRHHRHSHYAAVQIAPNDYMDRASNNR